MPAIVKRAANGNAGATASRLRPIVPSFNQQLVTVSNDPPLVRDDASSKKYILSVYPEPIWGTQIYTAAGLGQLVFFNAGAGQGLLQNGLAYQATWSETNLDRGNTLGEPNLFVLYGISIEYPAGMDPNELITLVGGRAWCEVNFGQSAVMLRSRLSQVPSKHGYYGLSNAAGFSAVSVDFPNGVGHLSTNAFGFPRLIRSNETFSFVIHWEGVAPILAADNRITVYMQGYALKRPIA
ncbi:MAG: hypothetical protein ABID40_04865 [Candidatus Bipolaricaulota bacterium]